MIENEFKKQLSVISSDLSAFLNEHAYLSADNPHIARLVEAFAFLHARLHSALQESHANLTCELINFIYPHLNRHIPSFSLVQFRLAKDQLRPILLKRGTAIQIEHKSKKATFKLAYESQIIPAEVVSATCIKVEEEEAPFAGSKSAIQIRVKFKAKLSEIGRLRFALAGSRSITYAIYNSLFGACCGVLLKSKERQIKLKKNAIKNLGFDIEQSLLPTEENAFPGYQLLTEFFCFTEKFLFFDLILEENQEFEDEALLEIYFSNLNCIGITTTNNFLLNVAPIINLFDTVTDPVEIVPQADEYQLIVNKKNPDECAIYSIAEVLVGFASGEVQAKRFSTPELVDGEILWSTPRLHSGNIEDGGRVSLASKSEHQDAKYFYAKVKCFNGDMPYQACLEGGAKLFFLDDTILIDDIKPIIGPTQTKRLCTEIDQKVQLLSFLSQHYLNLLTEKNAKRMLKDILAIYQFEGCAINNLLLDAIQSVEAEEKVDKIHLASGYQFCKGFLVRVNFLQGEKLQVGLIRLFCRVLDTFFAFYCPTNSFIQFEGLLEGQSFYLGKIKTYADL
jgi:type VI secretion system protein ImpG